MESGRSVLLTFITWLAQNADNFATQSTNGSEQSRLSYLMLASLGFGVLKQTQKWSQIQFLLGVLFANRELGDKSENQERSISHYLNFLKHVSKDTDRLPWAKANMKLGVAYYERMKGKRSQNIENAIDCCRKASEAFTETLPVEWATCQMNLGIFYEERVQGVKAENLELSIQYYEKSLQVFEKISPTKSALVMLNLGGGYKNRIGGNRETNLEKSIQCFENALNIFKEEETPYEWATVMMNMGMSYHRRIRGDKSKNISMSIDCYKQAFKVYTKEKYKSQWATTMMNLGIALCEASGDQTQNIEHAIECLNHALELFTENTNEIEWAKVQMNLGIAYYHRIRGEVSQNKEISIQHLKAALKVLNKQDFPLDYANIKLSLGNSYEHRLKGSVKGNIENSIESFEEALTVFNRTDFEVEWATINLNLGIAFRNRPGDQKKNIENAITCQNNALQVFTKEKFPLLYSKATMNLGVAYSFINLDKSIDCFYKALEVLNKEEYPLLWARIQSQLGNSLDERSGGSEEAIGCYRNALTSISKEHQPFDWADVAMNLGVSLFKASRLQESFDFLTQSLFVYDSMTSDIPFGDRVKEQFTLRYQRAYSILISVCCSLKLYERALWYASKCQAQILVQRIFTQVISKRSAKFKMFEELAQEIYLLEAHFSLEVVHNKSYIELSEEHSRLYEKYLSTRKEILIEEGYSFLVDNNIEVDFQKLLPRDTSAIKFHISGAEGKITAFVFVISSHKMEFLKYTITQDQIASLQPPVQEPTEATAQKFEEWIRSLVSILHWEEIVSKIPKETQFLYIILHTLFHRIPFHSLPVSHNLSLQNKYKKITYLPNLQFLFLQSPKKETSLQSLFVIRPESNLGFAEVEAKYATSLFSQNEEITGVAATIENILKDSNLKVLVNSDVVHFSGHSSFDTQGEFASHIKLFKSILTIEQIMMKFYASKCKLVILSSCESGLVNPFNEFDNYISISGAFLYCGCDAVISSLWQVPDIATSLLMMRFYYAMKINKEDPATALKAAQLWLQESTKGQIAEWVKTLNLNDEIFFNTSINQLANRDSSSSDSESESESDSDSDDKKKKLEALMAITGSEKKPFQSPYYWAAFIISDLLK